MTEISRDECAEAYKSVFGTPEGQIILADLMRRFGFTRHSTFLDGEPTVNAMLIREGQRSVLIHIGVQMDLDLETSEQGVEHG